MVRTHEYAGRAPTIPQRDEGFHVTVAGNAQQWLQKCLQNIIRCITVM